jgi:hypothetical protein
MDKSGIGVQHILPRSSAEWQGGHHTPDRQPDDKTDHDSPAAEPARSPPAPGTGKIVDRIV